MKDFLKIMVDNNLESFLSDEFSYSINNSAYDFGFKNDLNALYRNEFISGAISRTIIYWFKDSNPLSIDELENILVSLIDRIR